ncbi:hypothetical protein WR25_26012 [Diploscapter pachys]|uniref:Uncharacterized protein n=1 Tax=Diploscapter pachys TaxID=2018661 RepID=A0A2A2K4J3_9BILA|nr:hypothetical protein WR25_26012 [Diploscapter pachys]
MTRPAPDAPAGAGRLSPPALCGGNPTGSPHARRADARPPWRGPDGPRADTRTPARLPPSGNALPPPFPARPTSSPAPENAACRESAVAGIEPAPALLPRDCPMRYRVPLNRNPFCWRGSAGPGIEPGPALLPLADP